MEERQRRSFTDDYKRQAVDLVASSGRSIGSVAKELGLRDSVLRPPGHPTGHAGPIRALEQSRPSLQFDDRRHCERRRRGSDCLVGRTHPRHFAADDGRVSRAHRSTKGNRPRCLAARDVRHRNRLCGEFEPI